MRPLRPQIRPLRPQIRPFTPKIGPLRPQIRRSRPQIKPLRPQTTPLRPYIKPLSPPNQLLKPEKIALCGIIGQRPLRGRCPSDHLIPTYNDLGALSTADHVTLLRILIVFITVYIHIDT